ncbi:MAG: peroxiredoxin family protein [Fimbriimonas sp.]
MLVRTFLPLRASMAFLAVAAAGSGLSHPADPAQGYPPVVKKRNLYSNNDLRGKAGPQVEASRWLRPMPNAKGKVLVVHFFLPWCSNCQRLAKTLNSWQDKLKNDVVVVGLTSESTDGARQFVELGRPNYAVGVDPEGRALRAFDVKGYPFVAVISPDGVVRWQGWPNDAEDPLDLDKLRQIVAASKVK